jgi:hypothetical protein
MARIAIERLALCRRARVTIRRVNLWSEQGEEHLQ